MRNDRTLKNACRLGVALVVLSVQYAQVVAADDNPGVLRGGAVAVDITPQKFPVDVNGSMSPWRAELAHDPLHARCLVLDDGTTTIAIAVCDCCAIPREIFDAAKTKAAHATGIPVEHILCSATHTHTGVSVARAFQSPVEEEYGTFLSDRIAEGIQSAFQQCEPARIGWAVGNNPRQVFNRRWFLRPGTPLSDPFDRGADRVQMNPAAASPRLLKPAGPIDPDVSLLVVQARSGRPIAALANYSLHYVGGVPPKSLSADYFGEFARQFAKRIGAENVKPAFVGIMSNGTSGDINNINFFEGAARREPFEQIRLVAKDVADSAYAAYQRIEWHDAVPLKMTEAEVELGVRRPSDDDVSRAKTIVAKAGPGPFSDTRTIYALESLALADYPPTVRVRLQALRIGDLGIVSSPCETFVETGLAIKKASPLPLTFTIELANGYNGYLPTPEQHALGGYETWRAKSSYLAVDSEPRIRGALLKLLNDVAK